MKDLTKISNKEKEKFVSALTQELIPLRTKAGISQEELAELIGVSRQTYGSIERRTRRMTWNTYLSLIMFFDYNKKTHQMIRNIGAFPYEIIKQFNHGSELQEIDFSTITSIEGMGDILESLDEDALRSIKTMIMVEYARCTKTPGEVVVRAFDGKDFNFGQPKNIEATKALKAIKEKQQGNGQ